MINTLLLGQRKENLKSFLPPPSPSFHLISVFFCTYCLFLPAFSALSLLSVETTCALLNYLFPWGKGRFYTETLKTTNNGTHLRLSWDWNESFSKDEKRENHCLNFKDLVKICRFAAKPVNKFGMNLFRKNHKYEINSDKGVQPLMKYKWINCRDSCKEFMTNNKLRLRRILPSKGLTQNGGFALVKTLL